ncbi:glycosyltransferase [Clostridium perfringens]|uniref:glycosyltransferase n=1 Tax=Clostridium perfringens TaxID=1502 RepID=UPI002245D0B3|nr:glycosyltransferase [Clostridium perfringens]MCX0359391.1 glycosyltransferase [Clostridium perfringens]
MGYVGKIRNFTILKNIVDACQELNMDILFAGDGPDYKNLKIYCKDKKNVQILGKYDYKDISRIYSNIDIVWAAYPIENKNVKLAVSNRFYEACILKKPSIVTEKTMLGNYVNEEQIGFIVNPNDLDSVKRLFLEITNGKYNLKFMNKKLESINFDMYWENEEPNLINCYGE